jgi:Domain of unknown function (DUF4129)
VALRSVFRYIFCLLFTGLYCLHAGALPELRKDSSRVEVRSIPARNIISYKSDKDFQYRQHITEGMSVWDRFWRWFWNKVDALMQRNGVKTGMKVLMYVVAALILIYAILRFMGMEKVMLWISGNKAVNPAFDIKEDNIYGIDFTQALEEAVAQGRFREATRLHYLKTLRILSDLGRINWTKQKTNIDFVQDLTGTDLSHGFVDITRIYEYAWYGEFPVSEKEYQLVREHFNQFEKQVVP